jgi:hypothetical protein
MATAKLIKEQTMVTSHTHSRNRMGYNSQQLRHNTAQAVTRCVLFQRSTMEMMTQYVSQWVNRVGWQTCEQERIMRMARRNPQRVGFPIYKLHAPILTHVFPKPHEFHLAFVPFPRNLGQHLSCPP